MVKNPPADAGDIRDQSSVPGLGRSPRRRNGNPLQYSCLGNPMDRGGWWVTVQSVAKSQTRQNDWEQYNNHQLPQPFCLSMPYTHTHTHTHTYIHTYTYIIDVDLAWLNFHFHATFSCQVNPQLQFRLRLEFYSIFYSF